MYKIICKGCNQEFLVVRKRQFYCGPKCRKRTWKKRHWQAYLAWQRKRWQELHPKITIESFCLFCEKKFEPDTKHKYQKFCSYNCRNKFHTKRHPEWKKNYRKRNHTKILQHDSEYKSRIRFEAISKTSNKKTVLKRNKGICRLCGKPYEVIHHIKYSGKPEDLVCLCRSCHASIHQKFKKEPYWEENYKF